MGRKTMRQFETDIVVIAGGTAGLAAAISAAECGADVVVFEKASTTGGAGNMAFGPFAVESRLQRLKQIAFTREEAFKAHMDYTHWRVDARLVKVFIDKSADTIAWLEKMGVEFWDVSCHNPGFPFTWHIIKGVAGSVEKPGLGANMIKVMTDRAKELGVKLYLRTPAERILKEGGRIVAVVAEDDSGEEIRVNTKAAIIATGGFGDNTKMITKYTGYEWGRDLFSTRIPGLVGDGIRMAWEVGAAATEMIMHLTPLRVPELDDFSLESFSFRQPNLIVNLSGERFMNEETMGNPTFVANAVSRQMNGCGFIIFDETTRKDYEEKGLDIPPDGVATFANADIRDTGSMEILDKGSENIFVAHSLEELADKTGINLDTLLKTIDEYNKACCTGRDELFHKKPKYLRAIKQPKFYAGRLFPGAIGSLGGIKINYKTEVLTKDHDVIPGLYAAGTDANSLYGDSYAFVLPGNTLGFALNSGRIAGENAAEYVKSVAQ
jgi:fumarate reductase flavoprotein subunit